MDLIKIITEEVQNFSKPIIRGKIFEAIDVWHGSDREFDKFDMSKIGSGDGRSLGGWGIYFSDDEDVSRNYSTNRGFVREFKLRSGNFFDLDDTLDYDVANLIVNKLKKTGVSENDVEEFETDYVEYANDSTNKQVYDWLSYVCGSQKNASLFLYSIGFIGNKFSDKVNPNATNYVVFSTDSIIYT